MTEFGAFSAEWLAQQAEQRLSRTKGIQERIAALVGRGEAADGKVVAEYSSRGGLTKVDLDPRVMRMASAELSEAIVAAVGEATKDLQRQIQRVMAEVYSEDENPMNLAGDPDALQARLGEAQDNFKKVMNDMSGMMEQLRGRLGH